jgi:ribonuclease HII
MGEVNLAIGGVRSSVTKVILDAADVNERRFGNEVHDETQLIEDIEGVGFLSKHKADRDHPVVGAASILAKVTRDRRIKQLSDDIGENIGSGYPSDPNTKKFLKNYVDRESDLPPFARRSWETCLKLVPKEGQRTLMDF